MIERLHSNSKSQKMSLEEVSEEDVNLVDKKTWEIWAQKSWKARQKAAATP